MASICFGPFPGFHNFEIICFLLHSLLDGNSCLLLLLLFFFNWFEKIFRLINQKTVGKINDQPVLHSPITFWKGWRWLSLIQSILGLLVKGTNEHELAILVLILNSKLWPLIGSTTAHQGVQGQYYSIL